VFKIKNFARFQRQERLSDEALTDAIRRAEAGLIDADLGGGLLKQRVARRGQGKSGGYRTILAYRQGDRAVFLLGFAKNMLENIAGDDLSDWRSVGRMWLRLDEAELHEAETAGKLIEVDYG
jgi:hypothetical protein